MPETTNQNSPQIGRYEQAQTVPSAPTPRETTASSPYPYIRTVVTARTEGTLRIRYAPQPAPIKASGASTH